MLAGTSTLDTAIRSMTSQHGTSFPLGATISPGGVNFSVFSKHATGVQLLFFDRVDAATPTRVVDLDPRTQRSYHYWHAFVPGITAGQLYGYRVDGPFDPEHGHRFDRDKVLLDPYGKCVARPAGWSRAAAREPGDNCASALKSVVADPGCVRLGGRPSAAHALCQNGCLRDARGRLHAAPQLRRRGAEARHVSGRDREDSVPAGPGHHRRRTAAGVRLRRSGCAGRR